MTIRWGIIGCGDVCEVKSGPGFQKARGSQLAAVMRRDAGRAADFARRHGVPRWTDDADEIILAPDVDAVYIATPVGSHREYALRVAAAGKPCYVEKPMARSYEECLDMNNAFEEAGVPLFVAYYRRRLPRFVKVKELIAAGRLGQVTSVQCRFASPAHREFPGRVAVVEPRDTTAASQAKPTGASRTPPQPPPDHTSPIHLPWRLVARASGGGLFMDLGCHTLDLLDELLGPITVAAGFASNQASDHEVEDSIVMHFRFECEFPGTGVPGVGLWNFAAAMAEDLVQIDGTAGRLTFSTFGQEPVRLEAAHGIETFDLPHPPHVHQPLIQTIVDQLRDEGVCPSTGQSAARTAWVMDQVLWSYYDGRDDAFWERPETWAR